MLSTFETHRTICTLFVYRTVAKQRRFTVKICVETHQTRARDSWSICHFKRQMRITLTSIGLDWSTLQHVLELRLWNQASQKSPTVKHGTFWFFVAVENHSFIHPFIHEYTIVTNLKLTHLFFFFSLVSRFRRVRINPLNMLLVRDDFRHAFTSGNHVKYGTAGDCYSKSSEDCRKGRFKINLSGTGLHMNQRTWVATGYPKEMAERITQFQSSADWTQVSAHCGGSCAECEPNEGHISIQTDICAVVSTGTSQIGFPPATSTAGNNNNNNKKLETKAKSRNKRRWYNRLYNFY